MSEQAQETTQQNTYITQPMAVVDFRPGDTVCVHYRITEGNKTRIQPYEGIVISKKGEGISKTFIVRKIGADGVGVERIFPLYSPNIEKLEVVKTGRARRAKLYYLRDKTGRAATKVKDRALKDTSANIDTQEEDTPNE